MKPPRSAPTPLPPDIERHPLRPFIPEGARLLLLGSFPPPRRRWSMEFFYPNFQNDMWRIMGLIFFDDRAHFVLGRRFDYDAVVQCCTEQRIALYDAACAVRRLKDNASDAFLELVELTDLNALLAQMPQCHTIAATGGKSAETVAQLLGCDLPAVGNFVWVPRPNGQPPLRFFRMPSSSRAYPLALDKKAAAYKRLFL